MATTRGVQQEIEKWNKPQMKQESAVSWIDTGKFKIAFYCQPDALSEFRKFGEVTAWVHANEYLLVVDPRFSIHEVAAYINNYGKGAQ